jgi:hypothetical protein
MALCKRRVFCHDDTSSAVHISNLWSGRTVTVVGCDYRAFARTGGIVMENEIISGNDNKAIRCYLCGLPGADTKDHVPPKCLLPKNQTDMPQRITLPAHAHCNSGASSDEEYVRDLLAPEALEFGMPNSEDLFRATRRAWARPQGDRRRRSILRDARVIRKVTPSGLYIGKVLGVQPNVKRIKRVVEKIARGIIYYDTQAIVPAMELAQACIRFSEVPAERARSRHEPYWVALSSEHCIHQNWGNTVAVRRLYEGFPSHDGVMIVCHMGVMLWSRYFVITAILPLASIDRKDFKFAINTHSGLWVKGEEDPDVSLTESGDNRGPAQIS